MTKKKRIVWNWCYCACSMKKHTLRSELTVASHDEMDSLFSTSWKLNDFTIIRTRTTTGPSEFTGRIDLSYRHKMDFLMRASVFFGSRLQSTDSTPAKVWDYLILNYLPLLNFLYFYLFFSFSLFIFHLLRNNERLKL